MRDFEGVATGREITWGPLEGIGLTVPLIQLSDVDYGSDKAGYLTLEDGRKGRGALL